jgi:lysozyme family protein
MPNTVWERAINFTLRWEGGYINHPNDPGGETKYGISKAAFPDLDIKNLTIEDAKEIYNKKYWMPLECYKMDDALAIAVFDTAVNVGQTRARKWLKESKGDLGLFLTERENHYHFLSVKPKFAVFLKGWLNRLSSLRKEIIHILEEKRL